MDTHRWTDQHFGHKYTGHVVWRDAIKIEMLLLLVLVSAVVGYDQSVNYWQAFAPGKLLQRLDELTTADVRPGQVARNALTERLPQAAQAKLDEDADTAEETDADADTAEEADAEADVDADAEVIAIEHDDDDVEQPEADSHSAEEHSAEDYERNYEQFVRQYFDRVPLEAADEEDYAEAAADAADDDDDADDDAVEHEDESVETQAEASNVHAKQKQRQQRCRRIKRDGQLCKICREPRNHEVSETCSYSHAAQPEQYAYGSGTRYKRYRDKSQPQRRQRQAVTMPEASSLCERRMVGKSVCYECKDSGGQRLLRCYDAALNKQRKSVAQPDGRQSQQSEQEQRIYKRTISYSYAQGGSQANDDDDDDGPMMSTTPARIVTPSPRNRRLAKILRRPVAIPPRVAL